MERRLRHQNSRKLWSSTLLLERNSHDDNNEADDDDDEENLVLSPTLFNTNQLLKIEQNSGQKRRTRTDYEENTITINSLYNKNHKNHK